MRRGMRIGLSRELVMQVAPELGNSVQKVVLDVQRAERAFEAVL